MEKQKTVVETINMNEKVWYEGVLMTRREAKEMRENS